MSNTTRYVKQVPMVIGPVTLEGSRVRLVPLTREHIDPLFAAASFPEIWQLTGTLPMNTIDDMRNYVETAITERETGVGIPFATTDAQTGEVIGSTRFAGIDLHDRRVEIGWTWMRPDRQRTGINGEAKSLMLKHAFDVWGALRVEIKTDVLNAKSRAAIERLGAKCEGIFRQHRVVRDGRVRDTVYYSIIDTEWRDPKHRAYQNAVSFGITPSPGSVL